MMYASRFLFVIIIVTLSLGQVYNTGQTLRAGSFSVTAAPIAFIDGGRPDPGLYTMLGIGLPARLDLSINARLARGRSLFGVDMEWGILTGLPSLSLTTGFHGFRYAGIDAALNLTFPIRRVAAIYMGVDSDIDFRGDDVDIPVYAFGGVEVSLRRHVKVLMEIDVGVTEGAPHIIGLGFALIF
jgi:hypothetical protein